MAHPGGVRAPGAVPAPHGVFASPMIRELSRGRSLPMPHRCRRLLAAVIAALLSTTLVMPAPASAQSTGVFLDGAEPWIASDCSGAIPIVVGSDAKAQSDIYSAVTLAGVIGTDCAVFAGPRDGCVSRHGRRAAGTPRRCRCRCWRVCARRHRRSTGSEIAGRDMKCLGGANRWETAQLIGSEARSLAGR